MLTLRIDGREFALPAAARVALGYDARRLADPSAAAEGRRVEVELPRSGELDAAVGGYHLHAAGRFNAAEHAGELCGGGAVLLRGRVILAEVRSGAYRFELREAGAGWAVRAALRSLDELESPWSMRLTPEAMEAGWKEEGAVVRMLPVRRDSYEPEPAEATLQAVQRPLLPDDCHPFVSAAALLEAIAGDAGYALEGEFVRSDLFRSLYVSGDCGRRASAAVEARMGFRAGRRASATAEADASGRVDADPFVSLHSVGALVDAFAGSGADLPVGVYANGGCLSLEEGEPLFRPPVEVWAGFRYRLRYTTDCRIATRERMQGFDAVWLGEGCDVRIGLRNPFADRRSEGLTAGYGYRAVVFDHAEGAAYSLRAEGTEFAAFASRSAAVTAPARPGSVTLWRRAAGESGFTPYRGDWALYDGYVAEEGRIEVDVTVTAPAERITPAAPKSFRHVYFHGAAAGQRLTLDARTTVEPVFGPVRGYGARLAFADAVPHGVGCLRFVEALAHLFNLRFVTDEERRRLCVEPYDALCTGPEVDWSDRLGGVSWRDRSCGAVRRRTWGYRPGEGASAREGVESERWDFVVAAQGAAEGWQRRLNPLFAAALDTEIAAGPEGRMRAVALGDRDAAAGESATPRIVRWCGLRDGLPLAGFRLPGEGVNLCFGDAQGVEGLHARYDAELRDEAEGQALTARVRLAPHEFAALFVAGDGHPTLRSRFRLGAAGGTALWRLASVEEYDPREGEARCTFHRIMEEGA